MTDFSDEIEQATEYCTYCPKLCRFSCPVAEAERRETVTPWGLMRLLEFARTGDVAVDEEVAEAFFHCTGCLRCQTWCAHDNEVPQAMWAARAWTHHQGIIPAALDGFGEDFAARGTSCATPSLDRGDLKEAFDPASPHAYFASCHTRADAEALAPIGRLFEVLLGHRVRLVTHRDGEGVGCCGMPLLAAGDRDAWSAHRAALTAQLEGVEELITDCSSMVALWRDPERWDIAPMGERMPRARHIIEVLDERLPHRPPPAQLAKQDSMLMEGCFAGRHLDLYDATRRVIGQLFDASPDDFHECRDQMTCCGARGLYPVVESEGARECAAEVLRQTQAQGGAALVCTSSQCAAHLRGAGPDAMIIDIVEAACMAYEVDLAST